MLVVKANNFMREEEMQKLREELQKQSSEPVVLLPLYCETVEPTVFYKCDRKACDSCHDNCRLTTDIRHAANFKLNEFGLFEVV